MQRCPLAGSECGSMFWAKPWEADEAVRNSLLGRDPVCRSDPVPLSVRQESEWQHLVLGLFLAVRPTLAQWGNTIPSIILLFILHLKEEL